MKERVFLSNNQDGLMENYWMMQFLNVTVVLTNRVNCSGSTFNLTLYWRVVRDLRALLRVKICCYLPSQTEVTEKVIQLFFSPDWSVQGQTFHCPIRFSCWLIVQFLQDWHKAADTCHSKWEVHILNENHLHL